MALKGADSKIAATKKILEVFEGSFTYEKEIRIPFIENGEEIQLKCTITCAKTNVAPNGDVAVPGAVNNEINFETKKIEPIMEASQEEKDNVARLAKMLNL